MFRSGLFADDFLTESLSGRDDWQEIEALGRGLHAIFSNFPALQKPNESQTEDDLIWPVLARPRVDFEPAPAEPHATRS